MNAQEIVARIGGGVLDALKTNELFLGVEAGAFENFDIHPEYVTTVKVAETLTAPDHIVSLEAQMSQLRLLAKRIAWWKHGSNKVWQQKVESTLQNYVFGEADGQRLDILVRSSDSFAPPILMAEAKLGAHNVGGIKNDIDRIVKLFDMFNDVDSLNRETYGAVVFHFLNKDADDDDGNVVPATTEKAKTLLEKISGHLKTIQADRNWLNAKSGLISSSQRIEPASGYLESYHNGASEEVFAKHGFRFTPGLILLGRAEDVNTVEFERLDY